MRLFKTLYLCILFFVFEGQGALAQCGHSTHPAAIWTAINGSLDPRTGGRNSTDRVVLQLEMTKIGRVRGVEVLGEPNSKLRAAAIFAALRFAKGEHFDRYSPTLINVVFPLNRVGEPKVEQVFLSGVPGCTVGGWAPVVYRPTWPSSPPSWLFNIRHVMPVLAGQRMRK